MDKFEEAWKANRHVWESTKNLAKAMYLAGEEAQQAKVEELQKQFDQHDKLLLQRNKDVQELYDINAKHVAEKAGLQKRVDSVTHLIRGLRAEFDLWMDVECPQVERQIELLEQALKGGEA